MKKKFKIKNFKGCYHIVFKAYVLITNIGSTSTKYFINLTILFWTDQWDAFFWRGNYRKLLW